MDAMGTALVFAQHLVMVIVKVLVLKTVLVHVRTDVDKDALEVVVQVVQEDAERAVQALVH